MIFHEMTRPELDRADRSAVVVLPLGSTEQHGPHLPVDTDTRIVTALCGELERRLADRVLLAPTQWLGHSPHHLSFGATLSVHHMVYGRMLEQVIGCFADMGYRRILLVNGHGGNQMPVSLAQQEIKLRRPALMLCSCCYWEPAREELLRLREGGPGSMGHAGELETSLYLYLNGGAVRREEICDAGCKDPSGYIGYGMFSGGSVSYLANFSEFTGTGVFGRPSFADAEKGEKMFFACVNALEGIVRMLYERKTLRTLDTQKEETEKTP